MPYNRYRFLAMPLRQTVTITYVIAKLAGWNTFCSGAWLEDGELPQTMVKKAQSILAVKA